MANTVTFFSWKSAVHKNYAGVLMQHLLSGHDSQYDVVVKKSDWDLQDQYSNTYSPMEA